MIVSIRDLLLESDFSMCLAYLLRYEQPEEPSTLVVKAIEIKRFCVKTKARKKCEEGKIQHSDQVDDMFDFEILEAAAGDQDWERRNASRRERKGSKTDKSRSSTVNKK